MYRIPLHYCYSFAELERAVYLLSVSPSYLLARENGGVRREHVRFASVLRGARRGLQAVLGSGHGATPLANETKMLRTFRQILG